PARAEEPARRASEHGAAQGDPQAARLDPPPGGYSPSAGSRSGAPLDGGKGTEPAIDTETGADGRSGAAPLPEAGMFLYRLNEVFRPALKRYWRLTLCAPPGAVPREGPLLIAANHTCYLDPWLIGMALPRRIRFLIDQSWYESS